MMDYKRVVIVILGMASVITIFWLFGTWKDWNNDVLMEMGNQFDDDYLTFSNKVDSNLTGSYNPYTNNIIIFTKGREVTDVLNTAYHEVCHYIFRYWLDEHQRDEYKSIFDGANSFVSEYAMESYSEDFAESCMIYLINQRGLSQDRAEFMKKYVEGLL
jgi:hypothetical protein